MERVETRGRAGAGTRGATAEETTSRKSFAKNKVKKLKTVRGCSFFVRARGRNGVPSARGGAAAIPAGRG